MPIVWAEGLKKEYTIKTKAGPLRRKSVRREALDVYKRQAIIHQNSWHILRARWVRWKARTPWRVGIAP